jgi:cell division protein ZapE
MTIGPFYKYKLLIEKKLLRPDNDQEKFIKTIDNLYKDLKQYQHELNTLSKWKWFGFLRRNKRATPPKSIYVYGGVGVGKTMLMDILVDSTSHSLRLHFHELMRDIHYELDKLRNNGIGAKSNPINQVIRKLFKNKLLIFIDEMEVRDIADAMIISKIFEIMFEIGLVVVTTSNRHPDTLYKDGLQREKFIPFIELVKNRMKVIQLNTLEDYRRGRLLGNKIFYSPDDLNAKDALNQFWNKLTDSASPEVDYLNINGRKITIPMSAHKVARFSFNDLCMQPMGANDYLEIAKNFSTIIVENIPTLVSEERDAARRFVVLIDALYEKRCVLICSSDSPIEKIYEGGDWNFEFNRTISRLIEMQATDYVKQAHSSD